MHPLTAELLPLLSSMDTGSERGLRGKARRRPDRDLRGKARRRPDRDLRGKARRRPDRDLRGKARRRPDRICGAKRGAHQRPVYGLKTKISFIRMRGVVDTNFLAAAAAVFGWYVHSLSEQINHLHQRNEETSLRSDDLAKKTETLLQEVESTKVMMNKLESVLRGNQQEMQKNNNAVMKVESKTNQIGETLQKLQTEILQDLSDGIQDVRDARERDFTSLEKTVEERLTELTKSIHDNIAVFTELQRKSQNDIDAIKSKIESLELAVETKSQETTSLVDKYNRLESTLQSQQSAYGTLKESVSKTENILNGISEEIQQNKQDLQEAKKELNEQIKTMISEASNAIETAEKNNEKFESRLITTEENIMALNTAATHLSEKIEYYNFDSMQGSVKSVLQSHESLSSDLQALKSNLEDVQSLETDRALNLQSEMQALESHQQRQSEEIQSVYNERLKQLEQNVDGIGEETRRMAAVLNSVEDNVQSEFHEKLSSLETSMDELRSSINEVKNDLEVLGASVESLLTESENTNTAKDELSSLKLTLNELQSDVDKLSVSLSSLR
ncbi:cytoskeleton-associated protein 4-like [Hypanus sabinus]|uniref:cytoskeleton-associated protein 4-like n=1 Tax=Hypanus sabinus TaxID=79690 RepID=UPI0028C38B12|nr:cytoskeleton-associated protein 4-like [Hypanus sabinus]